MIESAKLIHRTLRIMPETPLGTVLSLVKSMDSPAKLML
jgi:hypothetical protein